MRLPPDIVFGLLVPALDSVSADSGRTSGAPLTLLLKSFSVLARSFTAVRENPYLFHQREKDRSNLGAIERVVKPEDQVQTRLKSRQKGNSGKRQTTAIGVLWNLNLGDQYDEVLGPVRRRSRLLNLRPVTSISSCEPGSPTLTPVL